MLIRAELLRPSPQLWGAGNYLTLVGLHGAMMMGIMTSGILGPFANYFVPLMIGARRMAFPRLEALSFWLLMAAGVILVSTISFGGFPTGWTGYAPLNDEANWGFDSYIFFFALVGISMTLLGLNIIATIVTMRAPGLTWGRLPIFCWGAIATSGLMVLAAPVLVAVLLMVAFDRSVQTSFFIASSGGSPYLFQNLFWFFGHPEVYVLALPGFGIILEILPVFARRPLWGYRLAVSGMLGVGLLSFFVWQHHLFVSGIDSALRPFYMLSTEIISVPTGLIFLCGMGTLWKARTRFTVPMLFCLAWFFNFFIGGISGVFLSDAPSDVSTHGSFFVMAHFHYTIMGGLVFAFFAAIYYWVPKMIGLRVQPADGKDPFLVDVHRLQLHFCPALRARDHGHAAAGFDLPIEPPAAQHLGLGLGIRARRLDAPLPLQRRLLADLRPQAGRGKPLGFEVAGVAAADAGPGLQLRDHPGDRLRPLRLRDRADSASPPRRRRRLRARAMSDVAQSPPDPLAEPPEVHERNLWIAARIIAGTTIMFFLAFVFAYFYLRSLNNGGHWRPARIDPPQGYGAAIVVLFAASATSFLYAARAGKRGSAWIPAAAAALVLGLAGCVVQVFEYANLGFGPQDGGYASVFMGWTITFVVFALLAMYWVEIDPGRGASQPGPGRRGINRRASRRPRRRRLLLGAACDNRRAQLVHPLRALSAVCRCHQAR